MAVDSPFAQDLLVRSREEMEQRLEMGDDFVKTILDEGVTLYDKAHEAL